MKFRASLMILFSILLFSCEAGLLSSSNLSSTEANYIIDEFDGTQYLNNPNRAEITPSIEGGSSRSIIPNVGVWTDPSGQVSVSIYSAYASSTNCGPDGQNANVSVSVGNDEVLIGGGAWTDWDTTGAGSGAGAFITRSYPLSSSSLTYWAAQSKDHGYTDPHTLYVYAVGLKLKDNSGEWIPRSTLAEYVSCVTFTGASQTNAVASVQAPVNFEIIGGGARVNWSTAAQLLIESHRNSDNSWYVASKSHISPESCSITAYAIAITRDSIPNFGKLEFQQIRSDGDYHLGGDNQKTDDVLLISSDWVVGGVGVKSTSDNGNGRLVTGYKYGYLSNYQVALESRAKDHLSSSSGWLYTYASEFRKLVP